ncbi:MAG TPA: amino acid adenylation domain-containing protein, partial [Thermoanaerobaculia bacterium]|nr:amino acid adenylation domain-containing protein [Thermoanaerobaculia bacterium]
METVTDFLSKLSSHGVKLSVDAGQLNCYAPKGTLTGDLKDGILKYKPELIALLESMAKKRTAAPQQLREFALSAGQKGLYILHKLHPGMSAYNVPLCYRIESEVRADLMARAWSLVLEQYPILTARIVEKDGSPYHLLDDACRTALQCSTIETSDEDQLLAFLRRHAKAPFDLERGPLTRVDLFALPGGASILLLNIHHILFDGVSAVVLLRTLLGFYEQLCEGKPVDVPRDLPGYGRFVVWEESMLASPQGAAHAKYWQKQLDGELPVVELPADWRRPATTSFEGRTLARDLPPDLVTLVRDFSRSHSALPSAVFLAAFQLLLHQYTGEDDVIVGMPVMGRASQEFANEIGYFINMIPLRAQCGERIRFTDFLRKVQGSMLDGLYHSSYPFPLMVDGLKERQWDRNPVFQVSFAYQNYVKGGDFASLLRERSLKLEHVAGIYQEGDSDFGVEIFETEVSSYSVHIQYNPALYSADTIQGVFERYCVLLRAIAEDPNRLLDEYLLLAPAEQHKLLVELNETAAEVPADRCIHELFAERAEIAPEATAVVCGDRQLTYGELLETSRDLALYLQSQGIGPDDLVGLCIERSPELVTGLLGILQAGGAYVPLDPSYPDDRLAYMLRDSNASIVLTQEKLRDRVASLAPDAKIVLLDRGWPKVKGTALRRDVRPHHLCYVIYTSGSTGQPKGVMVPHRGVVNHATYFASRLGLSPRDRVLQFASLSFDTAAEEMFPTWLSGAALVLRPDGPPPVPADFFGFVRSAGVTILDLPTAYWHELADFVGHDDARRVPSCVRAVILGGEAASGERFEKWRRAAGDTLLLNTYGPTEATIIATAYEPVESDAACVSLPIGLPIANARVYVLDEERKPVPAGIAGELYIGGAGVARGYLNRPELTAEKFIADPFSTGTEARLYRTGDRVRRRRDGVIEFLGRADDQVKIRGFRIEPGEIEAALRRHPSVRDAVVLVREDKPGDRRLIAFVVSRNGEPVPAAELRTALKASLPEFMVPSAFVPLETIPMLPNGKLDRRTLARMDVTIETSQAYAAPRNETESRLVAIWSEVLNVAPERIGIHDNFFELGGHSLLATRVSSKIRAELEVELPLKALFERTSIAQLAELIATARRRDIPPILPADRTGRLPLSFAQERLWFIHQLEPESAGYNVPGAVLLRGDVDAELLERAFNALIARHENLRTVFPSVDGRAEQRILDRFDFKLERLEAGTQDEARRICQADAVAPFDLANGPLLRGKLIRLADDRHVLMVNMHHIISDGWSLGVFVSELGAIVEALRQGRAPELPALPIQYADYSVWQRNWLEEGGVLEAQLAYWKQKLTGAPESLELPTDFARPGVQSFAGATRTFALDAELTAQLRRLAEQHGATLYMVLVAAVKALLHRYSGQTDIVVGSPIANRQYAETEGLIGMFVNTLALRDQVEGEEPFAALLAKVKATCLEAYEHQDAPFEKVVDAVRPQRNMAISPLFQVMVILQNAGTEALDPSIELYPLESTVSKFDLTVELSETADGLAGAIEYSTTLYRPETIARMIEHLSALCRAIVATPFARVCDLELLGQAETQRLLVDFNATRADYPQDGTLHQLFAAQAERHPEKTAAVCGDGQLTYGQLLTRSRELALYLQSQGVGPDRLVGICMERTLDMLVSMLGILEAGGAYVPLDPNYPDERLAYMLRDGRPAIVLTQAALEEKLRAVLPPGTQLIAVDRQQGELAERVAALQAQGIELRREVGPHHLAYVIYTSGSTGQPKGVAIEHHSPVTLVHWAHEVYGPEELAGMLASTSICFDLSVYEIFVTLAAGGTIILAPNALALPELPNRDSVTLINTVPSAMEELVRLGAVPRSVRTINLAGEPLPARLVDRIYDTTSAEKVYDLYGPSEDTTYSTYVLRTKNGPQTIGRPIANTQVYILDRHGRLQPIGVPGELYIAGDGLARGYLYRPELTAEKFVENPFTPGTRMYRTGDLARWKDDGTIQYLGRIDTQVKVRGFRIEIGEIEARLGQHPGVQDCAVIAQGEGAGKQLVAFYRAAGTTAEAAVELPVEELRATLLRTLPEYMVPAAFVSLPAIPLTPNGKVDRRALSRIDVTMTSGQAYVAPRNETERQLVAIWAEVLNVAPERIGIHDRFFELGGHSLLATQLISKVRTELGADVPLKAIFERNTVAEFAELLATAKQNEIPPIVPVDRARLERLPLSFAQERLWFIHQLEPESAGYNVPGAVRLEGELDVDLLDAAFNLLIERHETLRTIFPSEGGEAQQVILDRLDFKLERVDLSMHEDAEGEAQRICQADAATPFDLARGPLVRGKAIRLGEREHVLMLNLHHIISDGWSLGVLFREIGAIVEALREGRRPELPALPIQYADYSVWQRNRLEEGGVLEEQLAYWQQKLAGVPESLDLPADSARPSEPTFAGATHSFTLDAELTAQLRRFAEQRGGTLYMSLLAGFKALFHRYSGQDDICIGSPIANRNYAETEGLIGMFVNTLALRTSVDGDAPFATLFENVKRTCLEAYEHQDAPFERVVDSLRLERNLTLTPLFQVMVVLQNAAGAEGIDVYPLDSGITKFDLTVELTETAEGLAGSI